MATLVHDLRKQRRTATAVWLALLALSVTLAALGGIGLRGTAFTALLLITTFVKGQLIADHFMGLRRVRLLWRGILFGYLLVIVTGIGIAYRLALV